jgi:hypothetical protein
MQCDLNFPRLSTAVDPGTTESWESRLLAQPKAENHRAQKYIGMHFNQYVIRHF